MRLPFDHTHAVRSAHQNANRTGDPTMAERKPITISNIESICKKFGFVYRPSLPKHFVVVSGEEVEVRFNGKGNLAAGKQAFLGRARKVSPQFLKAYPKGKGSAPKDEEKSTQSAAEKPKLDRKFLGSYSIEELEAAWELVDDLVGEKKEVDRRQKLIADKEEESRKLTELVKVMPEMSYELPEGIGERIRVLDVDVKDLVEQVEKLKEQMESGEASQEGVADSVPADPAVVATDESKESLKPQ
jgi:hypothetical protein